MPSSLPGASSVAPVAQLISCVAPAPVVVAAVRNAVSSPLIILATNAVMAVATNLTTNVIAKSAVLVSPVTNLAPALAAVAVVTLETKSTNVAVAPAVTPVVTPVAAARDMSFIFLCAGAGAGGALVIVLGVLFFTRARRREPSLISQAIARERMDART